MNRICILLNQYGEFDGYASDEPVELFIIDPNCKSDRVYHYEAGEHGPEHVRKHMGGFAVGHCADGTLGEGDGTGKRSPSVPHINLVPTDS